VAVGQNSRDLEVEERRRGRIRLAIWASVVVVVVIGFIILAKGVANAPSGSSSSTGATPVSAAVLKDVTAVPSSVFETVGSGSIQKLPEPLTAPALTQNGKPRVVYIGAEYCPYCATERWPMVVALSRFGTFSNLQQTHSAAEDVYPNTQTFSFHGSSYTSPYLVFNGVETTSNQQQGSSYAPLDTPTSDEQSLLSTYDAAPYTSASSAGSIPFVYFGGRYLISGASYDPQLLQGKTAEQIASGLSDPNNATTKGIIGTANAITAMLCKLTNNQPTDVCSSAAIQALQQKIDAQPSDAPAS
jgi:hypothetical protein